MAQSALRQVPHRAIEGLTVRSILNSQGGLSVEAEVSVDGRVGIGSVPRAIIPGRRERKLTEDADLGCVKKNTKIRDLSRFLESYAFENQSAFDTLFEDSGPFADLGSDISLALSLAVCRAQAKADQLTLKERLSNLAGFAPAMPKPIVNIFSGGVHGGRIPFQQLMIIPRDADTSNNLKIALLVYGEVEKYAKSKDLLSGYSASSGMLTQGTRLHQLFDIIASTIDRLGLCHVVALGTDVAAEHLETGDGRYRLGPDNAPISPAELAAFHRNLLETYNFCFYEDPFGPDDAKEWTDLTADTADKTMVVGDDLFATNAKNIQPGLASGILLKMNQVGTISGTIKAAKTACDAGMRLCVSHRSKETEDTAMCDLAVGLGADLIKIGGPRRGDRIAKYNQLLRLSETL